VGNSPNPTVRLGPLPLRSIAAGRRVTDERHRRHGSTRLLEGSADWWRQCVITSTFSGLGDELRGVPRPAISSPRVKDAVAQPAAPKRHRRPGSSSSLEDYASPGNSGIQRRDRQRRADSEDLGTTFATTSACPRNSPLAAMTSGDDGSGTRTSSPPSGPSRAGGRRRQPRDRLAVTAVAPCGTGYRRQRRHLARRLHAGDQQVGAGHLLHQQLLCSEAFNELVSPTTPPSLATPPLRRIALRGPTGGGPMIRLQRPVAQVPRIGPILRGDQASCQGVRDLSILGPAPRADQSLDASLDGKPW
jgi:hypothetical protein